MTRVLADSDARLSTAKGSRFEIVKLEPEHARGLMLADPQACSGPPLDDPTYCAALAAAGPSYTALVDGEPVACLGIVSIYPGAGAAWGLIGCDAGPHMLALTRWIVGSTDMESVIAEAEATYSDDVQVGHA